MVVALLAVLEAGGAFVPLDPELPPAPVPPAPTLESADAGEESPESARDLVPLDADVAQQMVVQRAQLAAGLAAALRQVDGPGQFCQQGDDHGLRLLSGDRGHSGAGSRNVSCC